MRGEFVSVVQFYIAAALRPLVWDGSTAGCLRFGTFIETVLIGMAHMVHITLMSVGNVRGCRTHFVVVSALYTFLEGAVDRLACGDQESLFAPLGRLESTMDLTALCSPDTYFIAMPPPNDVRTSFLAPFQSATFMANVAVLFLYHYILRARFFSKVRSKSSQQDPSKATRKGLQTVNILSRMEHSIEQWGHGALRAFAGITKQQLKSIRFPVMLGAASLSMVCVCFSLIAFYFTRLLPATRDMEGKVLDVVVLMTTSTQRSEVALEILMGAGSAFSSGACSGAGTTRSPSESYQTVRRVFI